MRKKLDTRFPAARIKKIMQTDEDVGKIAMAVPLLVSKALELFLQDLCDRTYEITVQRGAKTVNSLHLKQCVQSFNVFDFLREIVNKVPDLGGSNLGTEGPAVKRRKVTDGEENDHGEELEKETMQDGNQASTGGRGRGRGRGRGKGRGRGGRTAEKDSTDDFDKLENVVPEETKETLVNDRGLVRNFDLNMDLDENGNSATVPASNPVISSSSSKAKPSLETKHEEYPGWSLDDMANMGFDPMQLANFDRGIDEKDDDYDDAG